MKRIGTNPALIDVNETSQTREMDELKMRSLDQNLPAQRTLPMVLASSILVALVLSGCQPKAGSMGSSVTPATAETTTGTGDSGGGNGLNGKFFESFAVNPIETSEWKNHVAPILENLSKVSRQVHVDYSPLFSLFAKSRNWYIAPVKLERLDKKNIGVEFIQDPMQQHALQTSREVWIEKSFWDAADEGERGLGLLHEAVMGVYLLQFVTVYEMCIELGYQSKDECLREKVQSSRMDPKPKRPLNKLDYANIRRMTKWLSERGATETSGAVVHAEFMKNGFDPRMSENRIEGRQNEPLEFKADEYFHRLADASVGRRVPKFCRIARGQRVEQAKCVVTFDMIQERSWNGLGIKIEIAAIPGFTEKRTLRQFQTATGYYQKDRTVQLYARDMPTTESNEPGYMQTFGTASVDGQKFEVGTDIYALAIYLAKDGLSVRAISATAERVARIGKPRKGVVDVEFISPAQDVREFIEITDGRVDGALILHDAFRESRFTTPYALPLNPKN